VTCRAWRTRSDFQPIVFHLPIEFKALLAHRSYQFTHAVCRSPGESVSDGLRQGNSENPDPSLFQTQHAGYVKALEQSGLSVTVLPPLEEFPDSVFVEDPVLMVSDTAIILRPGAASRRGEADAMRSSLSAHASSIIELPGDSSIDGGDILMSDDQALVGLSERTSTDAAHALDRVLTEFGYRTRTVHTPADILHFKSDCGLLDENTIFISQRLKDIDELQDFRIITAPDGEEAAANIIRVNDYVIMNSGFPRSQELLSESGYKVLTVDTTMAALLDGGLSCMSVRYASSGDS